MYILKKKKDIYFINIFGSRVDDKRKVWNKYTKKSRVETRVSISKNQHSKYVGLKVSKSQKHFFLKLQCPKNEQNIRQNSRKIAVEIY